MNRRSTKKMLQAFRKALEEENAGEIWDEETGLTVETIYQGLLSCVEDELYLQEFLPFGYIYRLVGEQAVRHRSNGIPVDKVMQEHVVLRDVFWDFHGSRQDKMHDFGVEKRVCQCLNSILQATVKAYQTKEPTMDVLDPLRDEVTGLFNSVYFMTRLEEEIKRSERYLGDVSVILIHCAADLFSGSEEEKELLRAVARVLRRKSRASDILARVERTRFAVLLPETRIDDAGVAGERLGGQVKEYLSKLGEPFSNVSTVLGIAAYPQDGEDGDVIMQEAGERVFMEGQGI